jgi:hypothetical protein
MAATKTRAASSSNGSAAGVPARMVKEAGDTVVSAARNAKRPLLTAGATAAGLAGGLALGSRMASRPRGLSKLLAPQRTILGMPVSRKNGVVVVAKGLGKVARELSSATEKVASTSEDVREVRDQLDRANRQSPVEVLLDGLTHRRGAHKGES